VEGGGLAKPSPFYNLKFIYKREMAYPDSGKVINFFSLKGEKFDVAF
jgi:hypothetical protein